MRQYPVALFLSAISEREELKFVLKHIPVRTFSGTYIARTDRSSELGARHIATESGKTGGLYTKNEKTFLDAERAVEGMPI